MSAEKTINNISKVRKIILTQGLNNPFRYKNLEKILFENRIHPMTFYYFVYAGCLTKINKGTYEIANNLFLKKDADIYKQGTMHILVMRKKRKEYLKNNPKKANNCESKIDYKNNNFNLQTSSYTQMCISHIKSLGGKVLMPTEPQYKEV